MQGSADLPLLANNVYYERHTWAITEESAPFGLDYRYAKMRECINCNHYGYSTRRVPRGNCL